MKPESEGVLVFDADGNTIFSSGLGHDAQVTKMLGRLWSNRGCVPIKRLSVMAELERPLTIAAIPTRDAVCFLIFAV